MLIHTTFIEAIQNCQKLDVTYFAEKYQDVITQTLAPLDYGPWRGSSDDVRYHFYSSTNGNSHPVSIKPDNIKELRRLEARFKPDEIIHWTPAWHIYRDWGIHS